jgi:hypothetical protein
MTSIAAGPYCRAEGVAAGAVSVMSALLWSLRVRSIPREVCGRRCVVRRPCELLLDAAEEGESPTGAAAVCRVCPSCYE